MHVWKTNPIKPPPLWYYWAIFSSMLKLRRAHSHSVIRFGSQSTTIGSMRAVGILRFLIDKQRVAIILLSGAIKPQQKKMMPLKEQPSNPELWKPTLSQWCETVFFRTLSCYMQVYRDDWNAQITVISLSCNNSCNCAHCRLHPKQ